MRQYPYTGTSLSSTVTATLASLATSLADTVPYTFVSSTACWVRQGTCKLVTVVAKASLVDTDFVTITANGVTAIYEFDVAGNGVTAGRVQVNVSADTTAATVAARLRTAILATQPTLRVIDPTDGTLLVDLADSRSLTITENVANAGFTILAGTMQASAAAGSQFMPAGVLENLNGTFGPQVGVIRDAADGRASLTQIRIE